MRILIKVSLVLLFVLSPVIGGLAYAGNGIKLTYNKETSVLVYSLSDELMECRLHYLSPTGEILGRTRGIFLEKRQDAERVTKEIGNFATITCYDKHGNVVKGGPIQLGNAPRK